MADQTPDALREASSCLPCLRGAHHLCRHFPNGGRYTGGDRSEPCLCEQGGHVATDGTCCQTILDNWSSRRCGKPAKGSIPTTSTWGYEGGKSDGGHEAPVCGVHLAAYRKRRANDEARRIADGERDAVRARAAETRRALTEQAEQIRPLLEALGLRPDGLHVVDRPTAGLALPGEDLAHLVRLAVEADELRSIVEGP